jgi:hypothetical protein
MEVITEICCNKCHERITDPKQIRTFQKEFPNFFLQYSQTTNDVPFGIGFCPRCLTGLLIPQIKEELAFQYLEQIADLCDDRVVINLMRQHSATTFKPGRLHRFLKDILSSWEIFFLSYFFLSYTK